MNRPAHKGYVSLTECDGRFRPYEHMSGMFYLAAYTRQSDIVTRLLHGPRIGGSVCVLFFADEGDARAACDRINGSRA